MDISAEVLDEMARRGIDPAAYLELHPEVVEPPDLPKPATTHFVIETCYPYGRTEMRDNGPV